METYNTQRNVTSPQIADKTPVAEYRQKKTIFRTYQVIWYILGFIESLLIFRFIFRLLGANPRSGFVDLINSLSYPFVLPFIGIFPTPSGGQFVLELSTIVALVVYPLLATGLIKLLQLAKPTNKEEVDTVVDSQV